MAAIVCWGLPGAAQVDTYWQVENGHWWNSDNWSAGQPGSDSIAHINNRGTSTIAGPGYDCLVLRLGDGPDESGTLEITGGSLDVRDRAYIGVQGGGSVMLRDGGVFTAESHAYIGYESRGQGSVVVRGAGSHWSNSSGLWVGRDGEGALTVEGGAEVSSGDCMIGWSSSGEGEATVRGIGSTWTADGGLHVGVDGRGSLEIKEGGALTSGEGMIGGARGQGSVAVRGEGSTWSSYFSVVVGLEGDGSLTVEDHAEVTANEVLSVGHGAPGALIVRSAGAIESLLAAQVGYESSGDGTVVVTGEGSKWISRDQLVVGYNGKGRLAIENAGIVAYPGEGYLGYASGSEGNVTVDGEGSRCFSLRPLCVAGSDTSPGGTGELTVRNGGQVDLVRGLKVWPAGTVNVGEGKLNAGPLDLAPGAALNLNHAAAQASLDGRLRFGDGSTLTAVRGSAIRMRNADLEIMSTSESDLAGLANLKLVFEGTPGTPSHLEVACRDEGRFMTGYENNFVLGTLTVGGGGGDDPEKVRLVDDSDNRNRGGVEGHAEALYVDSLFLRRGSTLDLNGLHLYWRTEFINSGGTILNGHVDQVAASDGNERPVVSCRDVAVDADDNCEASVAPEEVDNNSHDPENDAITLSLVPSGPYPRGETIVTLTVTDTWGNSDYCTATVTVMDTTPSCEAGSVPGDGNHDCAVDIADATALLGFLFLGHPERLPCGDGSTRDPANQKLLSWGGDPDIDLSDAIALLSWLFLGGPEHILGKESQKIAGCPPICEP